MGLEMSLKVNDALQERLEIVRDLRLNPLLLKKRTKTLPGHRAGRGNPQRIPKVEADLRGRKSRLRKLNGLCDQFFLRGRDPRRLREGVRPVRPGATLVPGVDSRHGFAGTRDRYLTVGELRAPREEETAVSRQRIRSACSVESTRNRFPSVVIR